MRSGTTEAENEDALGRRLREQGFSVGEIKQTKIKRKHEGSFFQNLQPVKAQELSIFFRQFSVMVDAGVGLTRCMGVLSEQTLNSRLKRIIFDLQHEVEAGQTLSKAMSRHPHVFGTLAIGLVRAGEVGGVLEETLHRLSTFLEKDVAMKRKVKSALTYPTIVLFLAAGIVVGLCTFIVPKFIQLFKDLGVKDFPPMTQILVDFSDFLTKDSLTSIIVCAGVYTAYIMFGRTRTGQYVYDRIKLKLPVVGPLNHKVCLARFARTLGTLMVSGVPILQAMETVAGTVSNTLMSDAILEARARIREGDRIGEPLKKSGLFPPMVVHMIAIGEESGALDQMLGKIADFYEDEVDAALASLAAMLEPILIVVLGGIVLFILVALWMPIISIIQSLSGSSGGKGGGDS
jgi:type IV pilus assembly protein PilC